MRENILVNNFFPDSSESDSSSSCSAHSSCSSSCSGCSSSDCSSSEDNKKEDETFDFTCVICQEQIENVSTESVLEINNCDCNFYYHPECLLRWYIESRTCPTCRKPIRIRDINLLSYDVEACEWVSDSMSELLTAEERDYLRDQANRNNVVSVNDLIRPNNLVEVSFHEDTCCEKFLKGLAFLFVGTVFFYILITFMLLI